MKIWISLAFVIEGLFTLPFIVVVELIDPEEKFWSLLAIVNVDPPPDANKPNVLNVWALPDTSLLRLRTSAISSTVETPVKSTVSEVVSAKVTEKLVADEISDEDKPNWSSGWDL